MQAVTIPLHCSTILYFEYCEFWQLEAGSYCRGRVLLSSSPGFFTEARLRAAGLEVDPTHVTLPSRVYAHPCTLVCTNAVENLHAFLDTC